MEFDRRSSDTFPFHDPEEAEQAHVGASAPSGDARIRHLERVPIFSGFTDDELRRVADLSKVLEVRAGTVVTQMGDAGDSFFVIIDGTVTVRTPIGVGGQLQPGDFFGEMSLLDGEPDRQRSRRRPMCGCSSLTGCTSGDCWMRRRT